MTRSCRTIRSNRASVFDFRVDTFRVLLVGLLISLINCATVTEAARANGQQILFVSIPSRVHFKPLELLAIQLAAKGHNVSIALPTAFAPWVPPGVRHVPAGENPHGLRHADHIAPMTGDFIAHGNQLSSLNVASRFHETMLEGLLLFFRNCGWKPSVVVVDRFSFAGFDLAHTLDVPFMVYNPLMLLDIDSPPMAIPAPSSGVLFPPTNAWTGIVNIAYRLRYQLAMSAVVRQVNDVRSRHGLWTLWDGYELYDSRMMIGASMFGFELPRAMSPLVKLLGPIRASTSSTSSSGLSIAQRKVQRQRKQESETLRSAIEDFLTGTEHASLQDVTIIAWGDRAEIDLTLLERAVRGAQEAGT